VETGVAAVEEAASVDLAVAAEVAVAPEEAGKMWRNSGTGGSW